MELLAPAGSMRQALAAINAGCNGIYGGLKQWSARNRAENFTLEEYLWLLGECHLKGIKFYLTLNTLLKDSEIDEVEKLLSSKEFTKPDAIIVADIGLINLLRNKFKEIPIHVSTQFGAYTLEDIKFLESLGVERVVLSRELSLSEIAYIKENSDIEIEVFGYGSQCIAFSGQCLWGGLINGCSGNRGKCIGMCRDLYSIDNKVGQYMYPQDIDVIGIVNEFMRINVDSLKIEGRLRSTDEITMIVKKYRDAIDSNIDFPKGYHGFLDNIVPVPNMLNAINPRVKFDANKKVPFTQNDLLIEGRDENRKFIWGKENIKGGYVQTMYSNKIIPGVNNISLKVVFNQKVLEIIDFINIHGERKMLEIEERNLVSVSVNQLYEICKRNLKSNIYEFISKCAANEIIYVDMESLERALDEINIYHNIDNLEDYNLISKDKDISIPNCIIQTNKSKDILNFYVCGARRFIYEIEDVKDLKKTIHIGLDNIEIMYRLPLVDFNNKPREYIKLLENKSIMLSKISQLEIIKEIKYKKISIDYTGNIWNKYSTNFLKANNITEVTFNPELSIKYNETLYETNNINSSIIVYGKIPLGISRACFKEVNFCSKNCTSNKNILRNESKGYNIEILCNDKLGVRNIVSEDIFATKYFNNENKRVILSSLSEKNKMEIMKIGKISLANTTEIYKRSVR